MSTPTPIHVWGSNTKAPYSDTGECRKCGLVATSAQIARNRNDPVRNPLPECKRDAACA